MSLLPSRFYDGSPRRGATRRGLRWFAGAFFLAGGVTLAAGCAGAVESSKLEDRARRTVPVPICLKALERRNSGVVSSLETEEYWSLVLPTFDASTQSVDRSAPDCSGRPVFDRTELAEAEGLRSGALVVKTDGAVVSPGADGLRVVWLPTHRFGDGTAAGPLALVRPREGFAEVYATGFYRGREKDSRFGIERMGSRFVVTAADEGCSGAQPHQSCESAFEVFVMRTGKLTPGAQLALDRVEYRSMPGLPGPVQHRLTVTPIFQKDTLRVVEQLAVRDQNGEVLRKSDLERVFRLQPDGQLQSSQKTLWSSEAASPPASSTESAPAAGTRDLAD